jgi:threonine dehydrogenase-like Zn-dependent dehydrogenase
MGVNVPGCFSERVLAPAEFVWPVPDSVSDQDAAAIEPLAVSVRGLLQSGARAGDTVAVLGCGVVGQLLIHAAVASGVRVLASDRYPEKLEAARRLGASAALANEEAARLWEPEGVSAVFECAGAPAAVELALRAAPRGSQVVLLGLPSDPVSFSPMRLVREGIQIRTSMIYDHPGDFAYVIDRVARGVLQPGRIVTHTYPLERIGEAMELAAAGRAGKIHIRMP